MGETIIDINVDVGEGLDNESQLLPYVSSCNIACGGHAGDIETMRKVVRLCKKYKVKIGAHPSFPDKANFGRKQMDIACADLYTSLKHQIRSLMQVLKEERAVLHHIKPHGALYNRAIKDKKTAIVIIEVLKSIALPIKLYAPYDSVISNLAKAENIPLLYEAFADRNYNADLTLVSRANEKAIILEANEITSHVYKIINQEKVRTIDGVEVALKADTFCVHGDHPEAEKLLKKLNRFLKKKHIKIL
ncbi:lactam utilization protein LamB [Flavobacteriales bacterium 34_180_T64]|nr:lactam utilization protein LamB [Flavobacteriales bacterium 34_180_T64]